MISVIQSYHRQHIVSDIFLEVIGSLYSFLRKCLQRTQAWITIVCPSVILSSKKCSTKQRLALPCNSKHHEYFFLKESPYPIIQQKCFRHTSHFVLQNVKKTHTQESRLTKVNFTLSRHFKVKLDFFLTANT